MLSIRNPVIFVNGNENWLGWKNRFDEYAKYLMSGGRDKGRSGVFLTKIREWNRTFSINFFDYRQEVQRIAKGFLAQVNCKKINNFDASPIAVQDVVFPTDDDDWYRSDIVDRVFPVFESRPSLRLLIWNCWTFEPLAPKPFRQITRGQITGSNSFAISGNWRLPICHFEIWNNFDSKGLAYYLDDDLAIWVRHPASFCELTVNGVRKIAPYVKEIPKELQWAESGIERIWKLTADLTKIKVL